MQESKADKILADWFGAKTVIDNDGTVRELKDSKEKRTMNNYILKDGTPVEEPDILKWAKWYETSAVERRVRKTEITEDIFVSTVFLAIDHSYNSNGPPVLWETMIFGGSEDEECERYTSLEDALEGHARHVALAKLAL